jgi:hypothetical protein
MKDMRLENARNSLALNRTETYVERNYLYGKY